MANTTSGKKKSTGTAAAKKKQQELEQAQSARRRVTSIILMAVALLLLCIVLIEGRNVWTSVHNVMLQLFGVCAYVMPLLLIYMSVVCAMDKPLGGVTINLVGAALFIMLAGAVIHIAIHDETVLVDEGILQQAKDAWNSALNVMNGGFLGALMGACLAYIAGKTGALILAILSLIVIFMLLTGSTPVSIAQAISRAAKRVGTAAEERSQARLEYEQQREEEELAWDTLEKKSKKKFNPPVLPDDPVPQMTKQEQESYFVPTLDTAPVTNTQGKRTIQDIPLGETAPFDFDEEPPKPKRKREEKAKPPQAEPVVAVTEKEPPQPDYTGSAYRLPQVELLEQTRSSSFSRRGIEQQNITAEKLMETLRSFHVEAQIVAVSRGPSVTRYELEPKPGVRISKITQLADDIALRLAASGVRIEAPIPNKSAIGIEVPNKEKTTVGLREVVDSPQFQNAKSKLNVALGKDITGNIICADLAKMPHLLIAGTTGSGKSVCMNTMIVSLLYNARPDEVKLLMIDPKQVEFIIYNGIAHLEVPVVTDVRKAAGALSWAVSEMQRRYKMFSEHNVRDIKGFNAKAKKDPNLQPMYQIVIFIDELSDLMMIAPNEVEDAICRLAQMARAAGMHLVIATQRPSVDVITGIIKANIPSRVALSVSSQVDSRTILDMGGAEKLLGNGDMLFNPVGISKPVRVQGCFISEEEVERVVNHIKQEAQTEYDEAAHEQIARMAEEIGTKKKGGGGGDAAGAAGDGTDEVFEEAVRVVVEAQMASTTLLQRKLKLGYARASRVMDELEEHNIVGPFQGSKPREVLITRQQYMERSALAPDTDLSDVPQADDGDVF